MSVGVRLLTPELPSRASSRAQRPLSRRLCERSGIFCMNMDVNYVDATGNVRLILERPRIASVAPSRLAMVYGEDPERG